MENRISSQNPYEKGKIYSSFNPSWLTSGKKENRSQQKAALLAEP